MKKLILIFVSIFICGNANAIEKIDAAESAFHVGENIIACGQVKQITHFKRGIYINLNAPYPNQALTLIVWDDHIASVETEIGALDALFDQKICSSGLITSYKGRSQMKIYNGFSIKKM